MTKLKKNVHAIQKLLNQAESIRATMHDRPSVMLGNAISEASTLLKAIEAKLATLESQSSAKKQ